MCDVDETSRSFRLCPIVTEKLDRTTPGPESGDHLTAATARREAQARVQTSRRDKGVALRAWGRRGRGGGTCSKEAEDTMGPSSSPGRQGHSANPNAVRTRPRHRHARSRAIALQFSHLGRRIRDSRRRIGYCRRFIRYCRRLWRRCPDPRWRTDRRRNPLSGDQCRAKAHQTDRGGRRLHRRTDRQTLGCAGHN